jgi:hypothetical protein
MTAWRVIAALAVTLLVLSGVLAALDGRVLLAAIGLGAAAGLGWAWVVAYRRYREAVDALARAHAALDLDHGHTSETWADRQARHG